MNFHHSEVSLESDIAIIDTHHHLWQHLPKAVSSVARYLLDDLRRDVSGGHNIVATVYVECSSCYRSDGPESLRPVGETEWVVSQGAANGLMSGIVGFADLRLGSKAGEVLDAHLQVAGKRFKGVRHGVAYDPHPDAYVTPKRPMPHLLMDKNFRQGTAELSRRDLVFEAWAYFHQLNEVYELARAQPDLRIVLCHLGGLFATGPYANRRAEVLTEWRSGLKKVAKCPNVVIKLGGIGFWPYLEDEILAGPRSSEAIAAYWRPELRFCIETFGPDRCMFESNFPVDGFLCDYVTLWNVFKRVTADMSLNERRMMFEQTARRTYRL